MVVRSHIVVANIGSGSMASDTVVRARIDGQVKEKAAKVLADMGLSVSDAIRLLLMRVVSDAATAKLP
jgi:DNA-damage-inducible protein J